MKPTRYKNPRAKLYTQIKRLRTRGQTFAEKGKRIGHTTQSVHNIYKTFSCPKPTPSPTHTEANQPPANTSDSASSTSPTSDPK